MDIKDYYAAMFNDEAHPLYHYSLDYQNPSQISCGCPMEQFFCKVTDHMDVVARKKYEEHRKTCPMAKVSQLEQDN